MRSQYRNQEHHPENPSHQFKAQEYDFCTQLMVKDTRDIQTTHNTNHNRNRNTLT